MADKRALKALMKYDSSSNLYACAQFPLTPAKRQYLEAHPNSADDLHYLKSLGLAFDPVALSHDEAVRRSLSAYSRISKRQVTDLFLSSLTSRRLELRSGLSAYAIMQTMPDHQYEETPAKFCRICSGSKEMPYLDLTALNKSRFRCGALFLFRTPYQIQFYLEQHAGLPDILPQAADVDLFNGIVAALGKVDEDCKPRDIYKVLKGVEGFKTSADECRSLLETLGLCSILETNEHKGYLYHYTNPGLAPSKSHSSDWAYPVDFWTGKEGINRNAFSFWFGDYKEIASPSPRIPENSAFLP